MAIREVLELGNPDLRARTRAIDPRAPELPALVEDLRDTLRHWRATTGYGRAIAAPQIGSDARVIYMEVDEPEVLVNPEIVERSPEEFVVWDACLSFLTFFFTVKRHRRVTVRYRALDGSARELVADETLGELLQHEIDHLDGVLAIDRITDVSSICTRGEFERRHRHASPYA